MVISTGAMLGMGALSGLGSLIGGGFSGHSAKKAAKIQAQAIRDAAQMQVNWERERATNAHQWEVKDLQAAGLNPILSAGGSGAQTGGIDVGIPDTGPIAAEGAAYGKGIEDMMQAPLSAMQVKASLDNFDADTKLKGAQAIESVAQAALNDKKALTEISTTAKNYAETMLADQQYKQQAEAWNTRLETLQAEMETAKANRDYAKANAALKEYENTMKKFTWWLKEINEGGRTLAAGAMGLTSAAKLALDFIPASRAIGFLAK